MFHQEAYNNNNKNNNLDALIVWSQIQSFIKGSIEAVQVGHPSTLEEYLKLLVHLKSSFLVAWHWIIKSHGMNS
jgi:hypothetical protein